MDWILTYYNTKAEWFGPTGIFSEYRARAAAIERLCGSGRKRVLDLGAGGGGTAAAMADLGHGVVAIEVSPVRSSHIRQLAATRPTLKVIEADFFTIQLDGHFDVVVYWDGFGVGGDQDQRRLLQRVASEWLSDDGCMLMEVFPPGCGKRRPARKSSSHAYRGSSKARSREFGSIRLSKSGTTSTRCSVASVTKCGPWGIGRRLSVSRSGATLRRTFSSCWRERASGQTTSKRMGNRSVSRQNVLGPPVSWKRRNISSDWFAILTEETPPANLIPSRWIKASAR